MRTKTYALALVAAAVMLFLAVVGANLALDPQGIYRASKPVLSATFNDRYFRYKAYHAASDSYDGLLFGSSRGNVFSLDELSQLSGGVKFAGLAVYAGMITDHLLMLEHVLREKTAKGQRLRAVFLVLDADIIGRRPLTNRILQYTWPPEITGENPARFWWRNLTSIQFRAWKEKLQSRWTMTSTEAVVADDRFLMNAASMLAGLLGSSAAHAQPAGKLERVTERPHFVDQMALLERFVAKCRAHDVRLIVAVSPRRSGASHLDEADFRLVIERISRIVPVWDFTVSKWVSERADLWFDSSHYKPQVAEMMLRQIFGATPPNDPAAIGVRRGE